MKIEVPSFAKINLFLNVRGKRTDGYHEIQSLVLPVSLSDNVIIETCDRDIETFVENEIMLKGIPWPFSLGKPEDNLVTRAALLLKEATGYSGGARLTLEKNIPIAGGLGGGSSNAASVLHGLNRLWKTGLSRDELMDLGARLGSDIPALVHGGMVCMEGRGDQITPVFLNSECSLWMVLINLGLGISTTDVYSRYTQDLTSGIAEAKFKNILSGIKKGCRNTIADGLYNALQKPVFRKYPLLKIIKNKLEQAGAIGVLLSGTGSTIFALVQDADHGRHVETCMHKALGCPIWMQTVCSEINNRVVKEKPKDS